MDKGQFDQWPIRLITQFRSIDFNFIFSRCLAEIDHVTRKMNFIGTSNKPGVTSEVNRRLLDVYFKRGLRIEISCFFENST